MLTVERLDDGEVSPYLTEVLAVGDELELRGPIGGYFVWDDGARRAAAARRRAAPASCRCARCCATTGRAGATSRCGCSTRRARSTT